MHVRRGKSRPKLALSGDSEDAQFERPSRPGQTPASETERHERMAALDRLLAKLSDKKREALVLHDFEGLAAEEIAKILDTPVMTVRTRVFYARRELYAALAEEPALAGLSSWLTANDQQRGESE
jgi:RNA polymerase sigma-70 factor (ECF subfamily)